MMPVFFMILIGGFFVVGLIAKKYILPRLCVLCSAVALTWMTFLLGHLSGLLIYQTDPVALALLMGGSAVGFLYYLEARLPQRFHLFKLPFFLSLLVLMYYLALGQMPLLKEAGLLLVILWLFFIFLFWRRDREFRHWTQAIIACCKKW